MNASGFIVFVVLDVLGPRFAPHLDEDSILRARELDHDQGLPVAFLVAIREIHAVKTSGWPELYGTHVLAICSVLQRETKKICLF